VKEAVDSILGFKYRQYTQLSSYSTMPKQIISGGQRVIGDLQVDGVLTAKQRIIDASPGVLSNAATIDLSADEDGSILVLSNTDSSATANAYTITLNADTNRPGWRCKIVAASTLGATTITLPTGAVYLGSVFSLDSATADLYQGISSDATDDRILTITTAVTLAGSFFEIQCVYKNRYTIFGVDIKADTTLADPVFS
jgi:hypothetical protein